MNIGIIGLGLIGGSLGKAILARTKHLVYGKDIDPIAVIKARLTNAITEQLSDEMLEKLDLVIVALPPAKTIQEMGKIVPHLKKGAILIDCAGTKRKVITAMEGLKKDYPDIEFVGTHPMAGREFSGIDYAIEGLFDNSFIIITPVQNTMPALMTVKELFIAIGAEDIEVANKDVHDKMIAYTSQLAHIVSSAYIKNPLAVEHAGFSAGSFKDLTRVARLNPEMWSELFLENKDNLTTQIDEIQKHLSEYRNAIDSQDKEKLNKLLQEGVKQKKKSEDVLNARIKKLKDTKEDDTQSKILLDKGLIPKAGELIKNIATGRNILIVTDTNVSKLYLETVQNSLERVGYKISSFVFPAGEQSKNYKTYIDILSAASENALTRNDSILALGGGVVSDIAGFAAATYMRGIKYITISTSLLGMVDAAIGGKTGIDTEYGKNLTGCFYQPSLVICDLDALKTLPKEEYKNGFGEVIKYAVLDGHIMDLINKGQAKKLIETCIKFKMDIVSKDEKEGGLRRLLNLGHTFGHAIEKASGYEEKHGEAVVKGMYIIAKASNNSGKLSDLSFEKIKEILQKHGFNTENSFSIEELIEIIKADKKMDNNEVINLVDIEEIGQCNVRKISLNELLTYVKEK